MLISNHFQMESDMGLMRVLKSLLIMPMSKGVPTVLLGQTDQWAIPAGILKEASFIISAGVGTSITFEQELIKRYNSRIILLDPSPTGVKTIQQLSDRRNIDFLELGLAAKSGSVSFGLPDRADEGSFRVGSIRDSIHFDCISLLDLMKQRGRTEIDLLKIDVEGFEYEIIDALIRDGLRISIICIEIHHSRVISIEKTIFNAFYLILRLSMIGYKIVYNKNMDFTFYLT